MQQISKAFKWLFKDVLKMLGFLVCLTLIIWGLMTFIAYPIQTITTLVIGFIAYALFCFFTEL